MGSSSSKEEAASNDPVLRFEEIYYDEDGNLRVGKKHLKTKRQKEDELRLILDIEEDADPEDLEAEDTVWYIMDAAWIGNWFAYTHFEAGVAPHPGPCRNDRLLVFDYDGGQWVPGRRLIMATKKRTGDYRRVTRKVWEQFCELYPGSGPTITTLFKKVPNSESLLLKIFILI